MPSRFLINQCQIITFLILKSDNIENSRIDLKGIILQVPSNQIKVTFIILLLFYPPTWYICDIFPVSHRNRRKMWVDYWGGGGGGGRAKGRLASSQIIGRPDPPPPSPLFLRLCRERQIQKRQMYPLNLLHSRCVAQMQHKRVILSLFLPLPLS